jgi:hypothetical protein
MNEIVGEVQVWAPNAEEPDLHEMRVIKPKIENGRLELSFEGEGMKTIDLAFRLEDLVGSVMRQAG